MSGGSPSEYRATRDTGAHHMRSLPLVAIRRRAALALLLLTALTGGSYALHRVDDHLESEARRVIDVTTRQGMLTQRVALLSQALSGDLTPGQRRAARQRLTRSLDLLAESHDALMDGDPARGIPALSNPDVRARFARPPVALDRQVRDFVSHGRAVAERTYVAPADADVRYVRAAAQAALLTALKDVVSLQQQHLERRQTTVRRGRVGIVVVTLLVLLGATLLLIQPLLRRLRREVAFVELLQDVAVASNAATSVEEPIRETLHRVCALMGWPVGHAYLLDRTNGVLASSAIWHLRDPNAHEGFRRASEAIRLSPGVDLPGRVLVQRRPVWLTDVTEDHNFPRKAVARQHGLRAAASFPVLVQDQVVAVLEFFSDQALRPDRGLLEIMGHVGTQLGRVVERVAAEQRLLRQARHDGLTDLVNRASFHERVRLALGRPRGPMDGVPAVLFIDLDNFKEINDGLGHDAGDRLLREVAARIASVTRDADAVARLGGDEFAVLLAAVANEQEAIAVAERITTVLANPIALRDDEALVGASIGIAIAEREGEQDLGALIRNADVAMYTAKARSAPYHLYTPQDDNLTRSRVELVAELRRGISAEELFVVYQPKVDLQTMQCKGVEALVRWRHPRRGILGPDAFLDLAEKSGQMRKLTRAVLNRALADQAAWHAQGLPLEMAVNLSPSNLRDPRLVKDLQKMLADHGMDAGRLVLEITENVLIVDEAQAAETVGELGRLGVALAIDDFGTGHSSLTRLRDLPLAELKIDRSFVTRMQEVRDDEKIVLSTIQLAHSLGLAVVAEGAETPDVIRRLTELGCDMGQGYAFSRPLEAADLADWARIHGVASAREPSHIRAA
jgi:diguanylate cyclase (GGDEF)-like protein